MKELASIAAQMEEKMTTLLEIAEKTMVIAEDGRYNTIRSAYLAYRSKLANITALNDLCTRQLKEDISEAELEELINEWGTSLVNGKYAKDNLKNLCEDLKEFFYLYNGRNRNLFAVFDMFVSYNTPWEALGYDIREGFRATFAAEFARTIYLTSLYYKINDPKDTKAQEDLKTIAENLQDLLSMEGNAVVRTTDAVCQIKGARLIIKRLTYMDKILPYIIYNNPFPQNQLTESEINAIVTFYKNQGMDDNFTVIDCLNEGGLNLSKEADSKIVLAETKFSFSDFYPGKRSTDCTLSFSNLVKDGPIKSYTGYNSLTFKNYPISDYCIYYLNQNFLVAPEGITRYSDFD